MDEERLSEALEALGFSKNEALVYGALLKESPATGYEVGARAAVPRSAVYAVLRKLVAVGAARSIPGSPERFVAVPAPSLVELLRMRFERSVQAFEEAIRHLDVGPPAPDAFTVRGYDRVLEEAQRLIQSATARLSLSAWPREVERLRPVLEAAVERGVYVVVFSHGRLPTLGAEVWSYGLDETALEKFWHHRLTVVADDRDTLIGSTGMTPRDHGVISSTAPIAEVATSEGIALDITLLGQRTGRSSGQVMERMLGPRVGRLDALLHEPEDVAAVAAPAPEVAPPRGAKARPVATRHRR